MDMDSQRYYFIEIEGGLLSGYSRAYADHQKRDADARAAYDAQDPETDTVILVDAFVGMDGSAQISVEVASGDTI